MAVDEGADQNLFNPLPHRDVFNAFANIADPDQGLLCLPGPFPAILGIGPWPKLGKNDRLYIKIGRN